jgi:hypothetical protein
VLGSRRIAAACNLKRQQTWYDEAHRADRKASHQANFSFVSGTSMPFTGGFMPFD